MWGRATGWRKLVAGVALSAVPLLMAACGDDNSIKIAPEVVVKNASAAIQKPQSFHFKLETTKMHRLPGLWLTSAEGDAVKPDKMVGNLSAQYNGLTLKADVVVDGDNQYWTDPLNKLWGPMPSYFNVAQLFDPAKGAADILANIKSPSVDEAETVAGIESYRLKGAVPPAALSAISPEVDVEHDIPATIWVGTDDFLLRQIVLSGPLIKGEPSDIGRTISISDFDKPVKVETPVVPE